MEKSIKINFIFNVLLNISKVIFPLITAPYISRVLSPSGIGIFNFTASYAAYFALIAALGIPTYGIREISKRRTDFNAQNQFLSEMVTVSLISTFILTILYVFSVYTIKQLNENANFFIIAGIVLYITPFKTEWFFSGREEFFYITVRSVIIKAISILCLFTFVHKKDDLLIYILLNALTISCNEIWNFLKIIKLGYRPYLTFHIKRHLKPIFILFTSVIAMSLYAMLDTLMLGFMSSYSEVGFYNCAAHLSKAVIPIVTSLSAVAMPRITYYIKENNIQTIDILIRKSISIISFLCFPIAFGLCAIASRFVPLFFGHEFVGAINPLQILSFLVICVGLSSLFGVQILTAYGEDKSFLCSVVIGSILNICSNFLLIPHYGASGAAISSLMAEFVILAAMIVFVKKKVKVHVKGFKDAFCSLVFALFLFPIELIVSKYFSGWLNIIVFIIVGAISYFGMQKIYGNESLILVKQLIRKK